ncbi:MAG: hypothetical protein HQL66_00055 [Magnetococcales bacterium]|nr:hypothetical protein [Magnetococcales bacterium]
MTGRSVLVSALAGMVSLLILQIPNAARAACDNAECFQKQAGDIRAFASKRKTDQVQRKKEFEENFQYENLRIEVMETTAELYGKISALYRCQNPDRDTKIGEIMNQLSKIQLRDGDKEKGHLAKKYLKNAEKILGEASAACKQ